jgi:predicted Zn-dependent protease
MALDLPRLRKLVAIDENDSLSRFALGRKLAEGTDPAELREAAGHLSFANKKSPDHLATYHILAKVLIQLDRKNEAREVLEEGVRRATAVGEGMGRDLAPAMQTMLDTTLSWLPPRP